MACNKSTDFLTFSTTAGLHYLPDNAVPPYLLDAVRHHAEPPEEFSLIMAKAGCMCIEIYGLSVEVVEVWRLPDRGGWYILHDDGDGADMHILIRDPVAYLDFQCRYIAPLALKVMQEDYHWMMRHRMNVEAMAAE